MIARLSEAVARWLAAPRLGLHLAAASVLLLLPALWAGWQFDDISQRWVMLAPDQGDFEWWSVFHLLSGDAEQNRALMEQGLLPWWSVETLRFAFFRPLSAAATRLDYGLWPDSALLMHAHSLLWLGLLVGVATAVYRRLAGPGWGAGLAALLYAVDEAHVRPAAWLANRNALLAAVFGLLCLMLHDRWRREGCRRSALLAPLALALALLSGELALGAVGYLAAYALFVERGKWRARALALAPAFVVLLVWATTYRALGFGASGSEPYVDPGSAPGHFALAVLERAPFLLMGQWWPIPADTGMVPDLEWLRWLALVLAVPVALVVIPLVRRDGLARFWCAGMLLAIVPACAGPVGNRLLLLVGLGAMGLLARFLAGIVQADDTLPRSTPWRVAARGLAAIWCATHLVVAPVLLPLGAYGLKLVGDPLRVAAASLPVGPAVKDADLVLVNPPEYLFYANHLLVLRWLAGEPTPRRLRALACGPSAVEIERVDANTLRVRVEGGLLGGVLGGLFRDARQPLVAGDVVRLDGVEIEVLATAAEGGPTEIRYRFSTPLEDPARLWMRWSGGRYVPFAPPRPGRTVRLPAEPDPFAPAGLRQALRPRPARGR